MLDDWDKMMTKNYKKVSFINFTVLSKNDNRLRAGNKNYYKMVDEKSHDWSYVVT